MIRLSTALGTLVLLLAACGVDARFGTVTITSDAPNATLSGVTSPLSAASETFDGCTGQLDPNQHEHEVTLETPGKFAISARSEAGPLSVVVVGEGAATCNDDEGAGHVPYVQITEPGTYRVHVASLSSAEALPYTLAIGPDSKEGHGASSGRLDVSVTATSTPQGATITDASGQVLGVTPTLFVLSGAGSDPSLRPSFTFELAGYQPATVQGAVQGEGMLLHAALTPLGPRNFEVASNTPQPITDMSTVSQSVTIDEPCALNDIEVDVNIQHTYIADLTVTLLAPNGGSATLHRRRGGARANLTQTFEMSRSRPLRALEAIQAQGEWTLRVNDNVPEDTGSFEGFTLRIECAAPPGSPLANRTSRPTRPATRPAQRNRHQRSQPGGTQVLNPWAGGGANPAPPPAPPSRPGQMTPTHVLDPWQ